MPAIVSISIYTFHVNQNSPVPRGQSKTNMNEKINSSKLKDILKTRTYAQFKIDNIFVFLKQFREFFLQDTFFYRGHANAEWGLRTSYDRYKENYGPSLVIPEYCDTACDRLLFQGELNAIHYYQAINDSFRDSRHPKIEVLSEMQHYGAATRLLDVTESFGVALFFAVAEKKNIDYAAIWAINKRILIDSFVLGEYVNHSSTKSKKYYMFNPRDKKQMNLMEKQLLTSFSGIETGTNKEFCDYAECIIGNEEVINPPKGFPYSTVYPGVFPVRPMIFNNRLLAQNGLFLLQQSLEYSFLDNLLNTLNISPSEFKKEISSAETPNISSKEYDSELLNTALVKFIIPRSEFNSCKSILKSMNINYKSLFPDKYGIIKTAEKKYFPHYCPVKI